MYCPWFRDEGVERTFSLQSPEEKEKLVPLGLYGISNAASSRDYSKYSIWEHISPSDSL